MMKLGTDTGSLVNHIYSRSSSVKPEIGMGVTILHWTDRSPGSIYSVFMVGKKTYIEVRDDDYKRLDQRGMTENQEWEYIPNPDGYQHFYREENGRWIAVYKNPNTGRWIKGNNHCYVGKREKYYDYSF